MNVALELGDLYEVERYAAVLEDFTKPEPLPLVDFFARGRALAAHARGRADPALARELQRLRDEGLRMGYIVALPAIEAALDEPAPEVAAGNDIDFDLRQFDRGEKVSSFDMLDAGPPSLMMTGITTLTLRDGRRSARCGEIQQISIDVIMGCSSTWTKKRLKLTELDARLRRP